MNKEQIISQARLEFQNIYNKYKDKGVLGIYLWGTITTDDFQVDGSDIDSVAIVENGTDIQYEAEIKEYLTKSCLGVYDASLRFITKNELSLNERTGYLTRFIVPEVIVLDMPFWMHMAGQKFSQDEFLSKPIKIQDILGPIALKAKEIYLPFTGKFHQKYFLKPFYRICYYLNQKDDKVNEPFSYNNLPKYQNKKTDDIIRILLDIRAHKWEESLFRSHLPVLENFLDQIIEEYT